MKVVVVDDEKSILLIIKKMLQKIPHVEVCGVFQTCKEAELFLRLIKIDLLFIDISMPEENGFVFAKKIIEQFPDIKIVFLTAHKEYAIEAFSIYALDYIIKPLSKERLLKTINRAREDSVNADINSQDIKQNKIHINCLGGVDVCNLAGETVHFLSSKSEELLVYLLVNRKKTVNKWRIIEDMFPDMPRSNAETYLNTTMYKLRKTLLPYVMKDTIVTLNGGYKIDIEENCIDFIDFENRINAIITIENTNIETLIELDQIYTGELCENKGYPWSYAEKERIAKIYWRFATQLSSRLIKEQDYYTAIEILRKLEGMNELNQEVNHFLMYIYAKKNDRSSLIRQYEKYKNTLNKELNIELEQDTINLFNHLIETFKGESQLKNSANPLDFVF